MLEIWMSSEWNVMDRCEWSDYEVWIKEAKTQPGPLLTPPLSCSMLFLHSKATLIQILSSFCWESVHLLPLLRLEVEERSRDLVENSRLRFMRSYYLKWHQLHSDKLFELKWDACCWCYRDWIQADWRSWSFSAAQRKELLLKLTRKYLLKGKSIGFSRLKNHSYHKS